MYRYYLERELDILAPILIVLIVEKLPQSGVYVLIPGIRDDDRRGDIPSIAELDHIRPFSGNLRERDKMMLPEPVNDAVLTAVDPCPGYRLYEKTP